MRTHFPIMKYWQIHKTNKQKQTNKHPQRRWKKKQKKTHLLPPTLFLAVKQTHIYITYVTYKENTLFVPPLFFVFLFLSLV